MAKPDSVTPPAPAVVNHDLSAPTADYRKAWFRVTWTRRPPRSRQIDLFTGPVDTFDWDEIFCCASMRGAVKRLDAYLAKQRAALPVGVRLDVSEPVEVDANGDLVTEAVLRQRRLVSTREELDKMRRLVAAANDLGVTGGMPAIIQKNYLPYLEIETARLEGKIALRVIRGGKA